MVMEWAHSLDPAYSIPQQYICYIYERMYNLHTCRRVLRTCISIIFQLTTCMYVHVCSNVHIQSFLYRNTDERVHVSSPLLLRSYFVSVQDLCWYYAQKTDRPDQKGTIPLTHVRLVYMSDDGKFIELVMGLLCIHVNLIVLRLSCGRHVLSEVR